MARYQMENGHKATALFVLAVISQVAVIGLLVASWIWPPPSMELLSMTVMFFEGVVLNVVGFFSGASRPDSKRPNPVPNPKP